MFKTIFFQPIYNLLVGLYELVPGGDIGLAIIFLTVIVKLVLWPLTAKSLKSQKALQDIQPKMEEIKRVHGKDQEALGKAMMALYKSEKVSPFSACLPTLLQLPVFIALYQALSTGLKSSGFENLYSFVPNPGQIDPKFFNLVDLSVPNIVLAVLAGISQFFQAKMMVAKPQPKVPGAEDEQMLSIMNRQMVYMMPVLTVVISWKLPGGLVLYWFTMNLLSILQQWLFLRVDKRAVKTETKPA
jgi:YidC/Oxa1 family membrane protein insertase